MNYQKVYESLISRGKTRPKLIGYVEKHHIIPRSLGGSDTEENIVELTAREHFIAHLLLSKIHGGKMIYALYLMTTREGYTNRVYGQVRQEFAKLVSENKRRNSKISQALSGKSKTETHRRNWKESRKNGAGWVVSEAQKAEISKQMSGTKNPMYGKTHSDTALQIIRDANKQRVSCPHCGEIGGIAIMKRWHFDNCKNAPEPKPRKKYPRQTCPHCGKEGAGAQMIANHFDNCKQKG